MRSNQRLFLATVFLALLHATHLAFAESQANTQSELNTITVTGAGKIEVAPDEVHFSISISEQAPQVQPAYKKTEQLTADAIRALKRIGIDQKKVQALAVNIQPVIDYKSRERDVIAHQVTRDISVKKASTKEYAESIQALSELGITRFNNVQIKASNEDELIIQALEKAYANAELKAKRIAERGARNIDKLMTLAESGAGAPQPIYQARMMEIAADSSNAATISTGLITITRSVQATFKLSDTN